MSEREEILGEGAMWCLACAYPLNGLRSQVCPECGRPFDASDATTFRTGLLNPRELCRVSMAQAPGTCDRLRLAGIDSIVQHCRGGITGFVDWTFCAIWVDQRDFHDAKRILSTRASEAEQPGDPWSCPGCDERIEGQFAMCWNCGESRP